MTGALEVHDDIVQLLAEAKLASELGTAEQAAAAIDDVPYLEPASR